MRGFALTDRLNRRADKRLGRGVAVLLAILLAAGMPTTLLAGCAPSEPEQETETLTVRPEADQEGQTETETEPVVDNAQGSADAPKSTPRDQWKKGVMPYLYQIDPEWSDIEYCGGKFSLQGCGPTALSMVYIYLTGDTSYDPPTMAEFSTEAGYSTDGEGSAWALMSEGAAELGLSSQGVTASPEAIQAELEAGRPVICVMGPGTFTDVGHFIVLERMASDGKAVVHDPNSLAHSMRTWDLDLICGECRGAWSFSAS